MSEYSPTRTVQFEYKGSILKGSFEYSRKDMVCHLEIPGNILHGGSHIPYFAPREWTEEKAEESAKRELRNLWDLYNSVLENKDEIKEAMLDYFDQKACAKREFEAVQQKIVDLRKSLREGKINNKDYQKTLTPLKKKKDEISFSSRWYFGHLMRQVLKGVTCDEHAISTILGIKEEDFA